MAKSTTARRGRKPANGFPLFRHASGRWCKKVRGKFFYFGKIADDPHGERAIARWNAEKEAIFAGRERATVDGVSTRELCDRFLVAQRRKLENDELSPSSFADYYATCRRIIDFFGPGQAVAKLTPDDFGRFRADMAKGWSPVTLANEIVRCRVVFGYAHKNGHIATPVNYGTEFSRPKKRVLRTSRNSQQQKHGKRCFEPADIKRIIKAATVPLKAMTLLGINCGFGNHDILRLPIGAVDMQSGWVDFPRPKTGIPRRCPLWPETIAALKQAIAERPRPKSPAHGELLFLTEHGRPWGVRRITEVPADPDRGTEATVRRGMQDMICKRFGELLESLGLKRHGISFYALRHSFETIGGGAKDQVSVDFIMGHADESMAAHYREGIDDSRLLAVVEHIRRVVFPPEAKQS